jgi:hypothetical protein
MASQAIEQERVVYRTEQTRESIQERMNSYAKGEQEVVGHKRQKREDERGLWDTDNSFVASWASRWFLEQCTDPGSGARRLGETTGSYYTVLRKKILYCTSC